jgi:YjjG family noncanonical pyrimidine nucleotidase
MFKTIFFDLDHTLWDFEKNSRETLHDLYEAHNLQQTGVPTFTAFAERFKVVNTNLWELHDKGLIKGETIREQRFLQVLAPFGINDTDLISKLSEEYLYGCPRKTHLFPHTHEVLDYLSRKYDMSLITNGFDEIQAMKLNSGKLDSYFKHVVTSQKAGYKKPAREIFDYALSLHKQKAKHAVMIGDNLQADIAGARNAAIAPIFFNPEEIEHEEEVHSEIKSLKELFHLL